MRKRLRKKKHVGEFQELGCEVRITLRPGSDLDDFLNRFLEEAVEANGLSFGGGGRHLELDGFLELGRRDAHQANLAKVVAWLERQDDVEDFQRGEPVDAWYAP